MRFSYFRPSTVVIPVGESKIGKPSCIEEARKNLLSYRGCEHHVYSGVCIRHKGEVRTFHVKSAVEFGNVSEDLVDWYLTTDEYKVSKD